MTIRNEQIRQVLALLGSPEMVNQSHEEAIRTFINVYPYVQPAYYILAKATLNQNSNIEDRALAATYSANGEMLYRTIFDQHQFDNTFIANIFEYLKSSLSDVSNKELVKEQEVDISNIELEEAVIVEEIESPIQASSENEVIENEKIVEVISQEPLYAVETFDHIDKTYTNNFISPFENVVKKEQYQENEEVNVVPNETVSVKEKSSSISKYDDDAMPYSFQWWLQKTRSDYYESSYQPFAKDNVSKKQEPIVENEGLNDNPLENQYKEHIFNIQTPFKTEEILENKYVKEENNRTAEIIDRFIEKDPQISAPIPNKLHNDNKARQSISENSELVTETLAKIYVEQMLYEKAILTYEKLSLKFPEKSAYFANLIVQLEGKINKT